MLSSLPTELIREIIESTVPRSFHSTTYQERQKTLCSLSLVSKLFCSIAQPLLFEIVWIRSLQDLVRSPLPNLGGGGRDSAGRLRCMIVEDAGGDDSYLRANRKAVEDSLRKFSSVRSLTMSSRSLERLDLSFLSVFDRLSSLQIFGPEITLAPCSPLISLQYLTLVNVTTDRWIRLLDPITLPNLRKLALFYSLPFHLLSQSAFVNLLPQLDSLQLDGGRWKDFSADFLRPHAASVLIDCFYFDLRHVLQPQLNFVHMRLSFLTSGAPDQEFLYLDNLLEALSNTSSLPLRSVYLDSSLQSIDSLPPVPRRVLQRLLAACQERDIDVVFEPIPRRHGVDPYLSEEFCRRQQASKRDGGDDTRGSPKWILVKFELRHVSSSCRRYYQRSVSVVADSSFTRVSNDLTSLSLETTSRLTSLSTLPPELLRYILEFTVPHTYYPITYQERQAILRSLSLVSKDFRSIAQPLLREIVRLETEHQLKIYLGTPIGTVAKELYLGEFVVESFLVEKVFIHSSNLQSLSILRKPDLLLALDLFPSGTNLVKLRLINVTLSKVQCRPLTALSVLSVDYWTLYFSTWFLDPEFLPALKALGIVGDFYQGTGPEILRQIGSPRLLQQLDSIELNLTLYVLISNLDGGATLSNLAPRSLVQIYINDLQYSGYDSLFSTVYQMRVPTSYMLSIFGRSKTLEHLAGWVSAELSQTPHRLRSLYFDPAILPTSEDDDTTHAEWQSLRDRCEKLGIELVYEDQTIGSAEFVSMEFWRRQKEARSSLLS